MDDAAVTELFRAYLDNVKAHVLGSGVTPDEAVMRSVELEMDIPDSRKEQFRRDLMNFIGALAIDGRMFEARTNPTLHAALQKVIALRSPELPAERGQRLLREGAAPIGRMTITASGTTSGDDDAKLIEARECFEQALADGDLRATLPLASMLREGMGGEADAPRARALYTEVCERSRDPRAILALSLMLAHGEGGPADRRSAYDLLRPLAISGDLRSVAALLDLAETPEEIEEAERFAEEAKQALIRAMS